MTGRLHLVGGGWGGTAEPWRGFLEDAQAVGGRTTPRIAVLSVRDGDEDDHARQHGDQHQCGCDQRKQHRLSPSPTDPPSRTPPRVGMGREWRRVAEKKTTPGKVAR